MLTNTCKVCGGPQLGVHYHEREDMPTVIWIVGHNLAGYMPNSSPYFTTDWESARESITEIISQWNNALYDGLSTHRYFEGREEWEMQKVIDFFESYPALIVADRDMDIMKEIAQCEDALKSLAECEPNTEWGAHIKYEHYWLERTQRSANDIPDDLEGDELEAFIDRLNEEIY